MTSVPEVASHASTQPATSPDEFRSMDADAIRRRLVTSDLFRSGEIRLIYSHEDRMVVGGATPAASLPLRLESPTQIGDARFCGRRELAVLNIGGAGRVVVDGLAHDVNHRDCLYVTRGADQISFEAGPGAPLFFLASAPAHRAFSTTLIRANEAATSRAGASQTANQRRIAKYLHEDGVRSAQLVIGVTTLEPGSVWNTMPPHTHQRRTEMYLYFDLSEDQRVFHFLGQSSDLRTVALANHDLVTSPSWSMHFGCGTGAYSFIWVMAGENQEFDDMQPVALDKL